MSDVLLQTRKLGRSFGGLKAVDAVDFEVQRGAIHGLIGPNGAGKTTFFNLLTGVLKPTAGSVHFDGRETTGLSPDRTTALGICRTFQTIQLFSNMTVLDNVLTAQNFHHRISIWDSILHTPRFRRIEGQMADRADEVLDFVGLSRRKGEVARSLPYGQQRLLEIARALATQPKLLLLDEPAAGMNPTEVSSLMKLIGRIRDRGVTVVLIEHNMRLTMSVSDMVTVLVSGRKVVDGKPSEVQSDPRVIEAYLGRGQANA